VEPRLAEFLERKLGAGWLAPNYAFLFALAVLLGLYLAVRYAKNTGRDPLKIFKVGVITVGAAFISARLFVVLEHFGYYSERPAEIFYYWQHGIASSGAYLGGIVAAIVVSRWFQVRPSTFLDCAAPSVALAICLGRVGCFLNGCCYGRPSTLSWAVSFPPGSEPHDQQLFQGVIGPNQAALPLHPTQLYEALFALALFGLLLAYRRRPRRDGELIASLFLFYSCGRFFFEFLRGDDRWMALGISVPQYLSILGMTIAASFLLAARIRTKAPARLYPKNSDPEFAGRNPATEAQAVG